MARTVKLSKPITAHGEEVSALTFRELTLGDLEKMPLEPKTLGDIFMVIQKACDIPPSSVRQIAADDMNAISEALADFLPGSPPTGES